MNRADNRHDNEVSWRAVRAGLAILALLAPACFYLEIVRGAESVVAGVPAPLPMVLLFLLGVAAAGPVSRWFKCTRQELLVVYAMLLVAAPVFSASVLFSLIQKVVDYYYFGQNSPLWGPTFFGYIPAWWAPTDPQAIAGFFEGRARVPWSLWLVPLTAWLSFMLALWTSCFCILVLIRRQWIDNERLNFPLAQIPLDMVRGSGSGQSQGIGRIRLGGLFWVGLAVALLVSLLDGIAKRFPSVPSLPLGPLTVIQPNETGIFSLVYEIQFNLFPWMLGLLFLVPKEITFTAWFLWLIHMLLNIGVVVFYGWGRQTDTFLGGLVSFATVQGEGGVLALGLWVLWIARGHFRHVGKLILRRGTPGLEAGEPLVYRLALIGLV
ncbi:MAG: hypothetical protein MUQ26_07825, partial [Armatimonadetes bacterium]|nr:hypothetical protein [Armatimonadota bacterium]